MLNNRKIESKSGSALLLTTILLFVVLSMVLSLTYITVMEQKMSGKTKSSVGSFYSAESGVEWALNKIANSSGAIGSALTMNGDSSISCPTVFGTDACKIYLLDKDGKVITSSAADLSEVKAVRSVGNQGGETQRAIEAAVASGGGGCYVSYGKPPAAKRAAAPNENCLTGFTDKGSIGDWGYCSGTENWWGFLPPAGSCTPASPTINGTAFVCCL